MASQALKRHVAAYLERLAADHAPGTVANYRFYLGRFGEVAGWPAPAGIDGRLVDRYRRRLADDLALEVATVNCHLIALRGLLTYLRGQRVPSLAPGGVRLVSSGARTPVFLEPAELEALLSAPGAGRGITARRDRAMLETLFATGVKVSELVALRRTDLRQPSRARHELLVSGGKGVRAIGLARQAAEALGQYLSGRDDDAPFMFVRHDPGAAAAAAEPLTPRSVQRLVRGYATRAGIGIPVTPGVVRHSVASHLLLSGVDLATIQDLLGHAAASTTRAYERVAEPELDRLSQTMAAEGEAKKKKRKPAKKKPSRR